MLTTSLIGVLLLACGGEPTRSVCDASCDLAVSCHEAERDIDVEARRTACLEATQAENDSCAKAADGKLDPATKKVNDECVAALDAQADGGECDQFTPIYEVDVVPELATPPAACGTYTGTIEAAQESTEETNEELCERFSNTYCGRTEECVIETVFGDSAIPQDVLDAVGLNPTELCLEKLEPLTASCKDGLYEPADGATDVNTTREAARTCLSVLSDIACDGITGGSEMPEECAAALNSLEDQATFAGSIIEVATEFQDAAQ